VPEAGQVPESGQVTESGQAPEAGKVAAASKAKEEGNTSSATVFVVWGIVSGCVGVVIIVTLRQYTVYRSKYLL
jgi:hypothetical protein